MCRASEVSQQVLISYVSVKTVYKVRSPQENAITLTSTEPSRGHRSVFNLHAVTSHVAWRHDTHSGDGDGADGNKILRCWDEGKRFRSGSGQSPSCHTQKLGGWNIEKVPLWTNTEKSVTTYITSFCFYCQKRMKYYLELQLHIVIYVDKICNFCLFIKILF